MQRLEFCLRRTLCLSGESVSVRLSLRAARQKQPREYIWRTEMVLSLSCRNMSCRGIFPFVVSLTICFSANIFPKQTLRLVRISPLRRSGQLIEIMDFVWRLSASFLSQLKLHLRLLERATLCARRYCATPKKPPTPPQPRRAISSVVTFPHRRHLWRPLSFI
jgi:hypothetical protein